MFSLPKLPYSYDALEPHIDTRTMEIHHTKHHQTYVDKLNAAVKDTKFASMEINDVLKKINDVPENIRAAVRNHGGGHSNHTFFWHIMSPKAEGEPQGELASAIKTKFSSFEKFREELTNAGLNRFGSGWAWLVMNNGKLEIYSTANQDPPLMEGKIPVLGVDVWEHAYYLKHQSNRGNYLRDWWSVINWKQVEENYKKAMK